jgi:hypothetical protein
MRFGECVSLRRYVRRTYWVGGLGVLTLGSCWRVDLCVGGKKHFSRLCATSPNTATDASLTCFQASSRGRVGHARDLFLWGTRWTQERMQWP